MLWIAMKLVAMPCKCLAIPYKGCPCAMKDSNECPLRLHWNSKGCPCKSCNAMPCNVLHCFQLIAMPANALQYLANGFPWDSEWFPCNALQCPTMPYNVLQCLEMSYNAPQCPKYALQCIMPCVPWNASQYLAKYFINNIMDSKESPFDISLRF